MTHSVIFGCAGPQLSPAERDFFADARPWGFILFARNIESPEQVLRLTTSLRDAIGRDDAPIFIDQEGGRVQRLKPPHWPAYPPARRYLEAAGDDLWQARELVRLGARLIAHDLRAIGVNADCVPVLDVPLAGAHQIVGDRAYADTAEGVAVLGRAACEGLLAGGVLPVIKHMPGHGRALSDSHLELPVVSASLAELAAQDFMPFLACADMPIAMTAHVVYTAIDKKRPATQSKRVVKLMREEIGFGGLLMSDDLSMQALSGNFRIRAEKALAAGCDLVLHCNGDLTEMTAVASGVKKLKGEAKRRADEALRRLNHAPEPLDVASARARLQLALAV